MLAVVSLREALLFEQMVFDIAQLKEAHFPVLMAHLSVQMLFIVNFFLIFLCEFVIAFLVRLNCPEVRCHSLMIIF
jgi:hypothetical protein